MVISRNIFLLLLFSGLSAPFLWAAETGSAREANVFFEKALEMETMDKLLDATNFYQLAILENPVHMKARTGLGRVYRIRKMYDRAIAEHARAKAINPGFSPNLAEMSLAWLEKGMTEDAIRTAETALKMDPGYGPAHYALAAGLDRTGQFAPALKHLERARQLGYFADPQRLDIVEPYWREQVALQSHSLPFQ